MKSSIRQKLDHISDRHEEITALLSDPTVQGDTNRFRELSMELAQVEPITACYVRYRAAEEELANAEDMLADPELAELADEARREARETIEQLTPELQRLLLPQDPNDARNVYLEVRAGTGGAEAALFAGDLLRMYLRYAEQQRWKAETISESAGEHGGYKEVVVRLVGQGVYARLKFESGAHRVQRVPETESQGRIHTSACTVAILPEAEAVDAVDINSNDLRIDTFRSSGAGGQHVNTTDSAVRITHLPTASSSSARTNARSIKTRPVRCHCCRPACSQRPRRVRRPVGRKTAVYRSAAATVPNVFAPTTSHRTA